MAGSSAEAEIYATNECVKFLLELVQILDFLEVRNIFMPPLLLSSMTIMLVSTGPESVLLKAFATSR
jgi:hypothetical protein